MEESELNSAIETVVAELSRSAPGRDWADVSHLLHHGEEGEAMDLLIAILVKGNVPISVADRDAVRDLVGEFTLTPNDRRTYIYLGDPEMLDRMTVVDEPSS